MIIVVNYIARDSDGELYIYENEKPVRMKDIWGFGGSSDNKEQPVCYNLYATGDENVPERSFTNIDNELFRNVLWKDEPLLLNEANWMPIYILPEPKVGEVPKYLIRTQIGDIIEYDCAYCIPGYGWTCADINENTQWYKIC